ncbi:hypothetical protein T08_6341 [Trichinella sp. T8]|nr:hypothetical protein T08_6341 [Trichinella sp. T8]
MIICSVAMDADVDKVITLSEFCKAHTFYDHFALISCQLIFVALCIKKFCKITSLYVVLSRAESEHEFNN